MFAFTTAFPVAIPRAKRTELSTCRRRRSVIVCGTKEKKKKKMIELTPEQSKGWEDVRALLMNDFGFEMKTADKVIMRAFGWGKSKYWRNLVKNETPDVNVVSSRITFLKSDLGFDDHIIPSMVKEFPEVVRLPIERMQLSLQHIRDNYPVLAARPEAMKASLSEQPAALGFDVDCGGDCAGECKRCWVRFE